MITLHWLYALAGGWNAWVEQNMPVAEKVSP